MSFNVKLNMLNVDRGSFDAYIHTYIHHLFVIAGLVDGSLRQADVDLLSKI